MAVVDASRQLGQLLVDANLLTVDDLAFGERAAEVAKTPLPVHLVATGRVRRSDVLSVIARHFHLEFFDPALGFTPNPDALGRLSGSVAETENALPLRLDPAGLVVATDDPFDTGKRERLARAANGDIVLVLGPAAGLKEAIAQSYDDDQPAPVRQISGTAEDPGYHLNELLALLIDVGGSDLHLTAGSPPLIRLNGDLRPIEGYERLQPAQLRTLVYAILTGRQREDFEERLELDASHPVPGKGRFRVNVFLQRGSVGAVMRAIPNRILSLEELGMPPVVSEFGDLPRGLVLVTGATGSGKSTTLAALIDQINTTRAVHVMTVEDPIEFMHRHKRSIVNQREVGADTGSFAAALRHALRQDPDVILVGEMRDLETMSTALTAAETGHLVLATLHTQDAPGSIERIIDVFPAHQQQQVRVQLAESIQGVVTQQLVPTSDGSGRAAAVEILVATPAIRNLIREGKGHQIRSAIQAGGRHGMQTMDHALAQLVRTGRIDLRLATERAQNVDEFMTLVGGSKR